MRFPRSSAVSAVLLSTVVNAQSTFSLDSKEAIIESSKILAWDLLQFYNGNETGMTPGILPGPPPAGPYYWWEAGAMWGALIEYARYTGDSQYNDLIEEAILAQTGDGLDFMPVEHTLSLGNDDQGFWGMTAMLAAESGFRDPPSDKAQWLSLAQAVWNTMVDPSRHDDTCGGGLRWQIPFSNKGYDYKNTIANACYFNIGSRLARYTGNSTYAEHAESTWDWIAGVGYIDPETWNVYDGGHVPMNCTDINKQQFSYNIAALLQGAGHMYNYTNGDEKWRNRIEKMLVPMFDTFFPDDIAFEVACEPYDGQCTVDMLSFKGYVHRWLTQLTKVAPFTHDTIMPILRKSATAAINQCTGGDTGRACGFRWSSGAYDASYGTGAGQQMNVMSAVMSLLVDDIGPPLTSDTGGTSKGDPNAGSNSDKFLRHEKTITGGAKAGAGILTFVVLAGALGTFIWMSLGA